MYSEAEFSRGNEGEVLVTIHIILVIFQTPVFYVKRNIKKGVKSTACERSEKKRVAAVEVVVSKPEKQQSCKTEGKHRPKETHYSTL